MNLDVQLEGDEPRVVAVALHNMITGARDMLYRDPPNNRGVREHVERDIATAVGVLEQLDKWGARDPDKFRENRQASGG